MSRGSRWAGAAVVLTGMLCIGVGAHAAGRRLRWPIRSCSSGRGKGWEIVERKRLSRRSCLGRGQPSGWQPLRMVNGGSVRRLSGLGGPLGRRESGREAVVESAENDFRRVGGLGDASAGSAPDAHGAERRV